MKRILVLILCFAMTLGAVALNIRAEKGMPSKDALDGYENICLTYTFDYYNSYNNYGAHSVDDLLSYVGYYDRNGKLCDYFFDSFLFLPCVSYGPSGNSMVGSFAEPSKLLDWTMYIEDTFKDGYNVDALNTAFGEVKSELGDTSDKKAGVFFTILYPVNTQTNFGTVNGKALDFSKNEDRKTAIKWEIDEQIRLYTEGGYDYLDMVGFYWFEEYLFNYEYTEEDIELFNYASEYLHSLGLKLIWIPWYQAYGADRWEELGIDVACMQPNLFWSDNPDYNRVKTSIEYSKQNGLCMELEIDPLAFYSAEHQKRYFLYLEQGMQCGAMDSVKMYYQDKKPAVFKQACESTDFNKRVIYDLTYKYAKGTLTQEDIDAARIGDYPAGTPNSPIVPPNDNSNGSSGEDSESLPDNSTPLGDVNGDAIIDQYDYILVKRYYFETLVLSNEELERADVNRDDRVDQYDYILIARHYFGTYVIK